MLYLHIYLEKPSVLEYSAGIHVYISFHWYKIMHTQAAKKRGNACKGITRLMQFRLHVQNFSLPSCFWDWTRMQTSACVVCLEVVSVITPLIVISGAVRELFWRNRYLDLFCRNRGLDEFQEAFHVRAIALRAALQHIALALQATRVLLFPSPFSSYFLSVLICPIL